MSKALLLAIAAAAGMGAHGFEREYGAGIDSFNLARYDDARAHFQRARDLAPTKPGPWRWLGRVARVQERWEECLTASRQALILAPTSRQADEVRSDHARCREALHRPAYYRPLPAGQGALCVTTSTPAPDSEGQLVLVDGIQKGRTPLDPVPLSAGPHTVVVGKNEMRVEVVEGIVADAVVP